MTEEILNHLAKDKVLKKLIQQIEPKKRVAQPSVYEALLRAINFQQLSGKAATAIHTRFLDLFPDQFPNPELLIEFSQEQLREVGLSRQKSGYMQNVAHFFVEHKLMSYDWDAAPDEEIINKLTQIKGVGNWTVEMILMFTLNRPDVLPLDDLVVKNAMIELYKVNETGKALNKKLLKIAEPWQPYRTTASRYLWQWKDTVL